MSTLGRESYRRSVYARFSVAALALVAGGGCSAGQDFDECRVAADCTPGLVCSPEHYCVLQSNLIDVHPLIDEALCPFPEGPIDDPQALIIGAILPLSGKDKDTGFALGQATTLAVQEINGAEAGKVGPRGRPLAVLFCDSSSTVEGALAAAAHLAKFGIPVVLGPSGEAAAKAAVDEYATAGTLGMLPLAVSSPILLEAGAEASAWPVAPDDANWARAIGAILTQRAAFGLQTEGPIVLLHPEGEVGLARRDAVLDVLPAGAAASIAYPRQGKFDDAAVALAGVVPSAIALLGDEEVAPIVAFVERLAVSSGFPRPISWLVSPAGRSSALFSVFDQVENEALDRDAVLARVQGVANALRGEAYDGFAERLLAKYGGQTLLTTHSAQAYDAVYMVAFALGAASARFDLPTYRTADVLDGLKRLSEGEEVVLSPEGAQRARLVLSSPVAAIDIEGASGPLDFDAQGRQGAAPVVLWRPLVEQGSFSEEALSF